MDNNRQEKNNLENAIDGGIMDKMGQVLDNVFETVTGDNQNNSQQRNQRNKNNK